MITEKEYVKIVPLEHRKKFAQFFTPEKISDFMATWVLNGRKSHVDILEPAFGLGIFSRSMYKQNPEIRVVGYDIDRIISTYAKDFFVKPRYDVSINNENYLTASWSDKYDGIICNPPYFKFHDYDNATLIPIVNNKLHIHLNGFSNIYTLFLLKSIFQLNDGGRMAYIIPSEFLNSDYGVEVKRTLLKSGVLRHVIIVDFTKCAFDDALTTACILLCENSDNSNRVYFSNIDNIDNLESALTEYVTFASCQLKPENKWKQYYESKKLFKYNHLTPFSTFARVSRGIATGANNYFTFKQSIIEKYNIPLNAFRHCICHAADVQNLIFTDDDFESISKSDKTVFLFDGNGNERDPYVQTYLRLGETNGINNKYLTANRTPWYALENRPPSPIWVSVFNRSGLRFVRNKAGVYNLTTFHCVYNLGEIDTDILFAYLVTNVAKEIFLENSRQYGNGLIKFEPNDLNKGNVLDLRLLTTEEKSFILNAYRKLRFNDSICNITISILDEFFRTKYSGGQIDLPYFFRKIEGVIPNKKTTQKIDKVKNERMKQLKFIDLFEQYANSPIIENDLSLNGYQHKNNTYGSTTIDLTKNVLISYVKADNMEQYLDQSAKIYYTGKKFPSSVALNKLYYFMPYIKHKGIRDLYIIKIARVGTRKEGQPDNDPNDFRLVFEIEFIKELFKEYMPVDLEIWHTFTDTNLKTILKMKET